MIQYLLDTNICIYVAKRRPQSVLSRFRELKPGDVGMSVITYLELSYGAWKSLHPDRNLAKIDELRTIIPVQPLESDVAVHYGKIRARLERQGRPIGAYDLLIAAHALSLGVVLVTNNSREFSRIPDVRLENWVVPAV